MNRLVLLSPLILAACAPDPVVATPMDFTILTIENLSATELQRLHDARIYFGHHSVGADILQGIAELVAERPDINLHLVETDDPSTVEGPCLAHGRVGRNTDPASKRAGFLEVLTASPDLDLALMKFCYVDVTSGTDPEAFVVDYQHTLGTLHAAHPELPLAHVTVPLRAGPAGLAARAKDLLRGLAGRPRALEHNRTRNAVNGMLRSRFDSDALFDLARVQSTRADGTVCREAGDAMIPCLAPEYTSDGGHLSPEGRRRVAEAFLVFLARRL